MASVAAEPVPRSFEFGPFVLIPERQVLLNGGEVVRIGGRALDVLTALVERPGELIGKRELMERAWPDVKVDEANLKVNMSALRRALGDGAGATLYIATVTGRGYRFVAPVRTSGETGVSAVASSTARRSHNLPTGTTRVFGRADAINAIQRDLEASRLVSIVGAGGIGKTTVALAVAERAARSFKHGVWLVDLAVLNEPDLVPNAVATALGVVAHLPSVLDAVSEFLRDRETLLVLDSCEHVIDAAALCANKILAAAAGVKILVTSREPLGVNGERLRRLSGLATPPSSPALSAEQALAFPAIQLFVERASDRLETFKLSDADAPAVAEICRSLDGFALAIELAATRIDAFGVSGLRKQLDDRFRLLTGRRAGPERHRTLAATLDWSYSLLSTDEAALLCAVSVFAGVFDIDGAAAVADIAPPQTADTLAQLAAKSLLATDLDADGVAYRLLETTRSYCLERLHASGTEQVIKRRHAEYVCALNERAAREWAELPIHAWGAAYGRFLDDLRGALAWASQDEGNRTLRIRLTVAGLLLWNHFSLYEECRMHVSYAVEQIEAAGLPGTAAEMQLQVWLGSATMFTRGLTSGAMDAMRRALAIADQLGDRDGRMRCLRLIGVYELFHGENAAALRTLQDFAAMAAADDPAVMLEAEVSLGIAQYFVGELVGVRERFERRHQLDQQEINDPPRAVYHVRYLSDRVVDTADLLCQVQWVTGSPDKALRTAATAVECAMRTKHHLSLNNALSYVCPVFYWTGRYAECARLVTMLEEQVRQHGYATRRPVAMFYRAAIECAQSTRLGNEVDGLARAIECFYATGHLARMPFYLSVMAGFLVQGGRLDEASTAIRAALDRAEAKQERWSFPELLRVQASILSAEGKSAEAEALLLKSLAYAQELSALSWRVRAASDLARLWHAQARSRDAYKLLQPVCAALTEGFDTRDVVVARDILSALVDVQPR